MPFTERQKSWIAVICGIVFFLAVGGYSLYLSQEEAKGSKRVGIWRTKTSDAKLPAR